MSATSADGLYAVCGSFIGLSVFTLSLRFYSRHHQALSVGVDDWAALFGVITYIGASACAIELVVLGVFGYSALTPAQSAAKAKSAIQLSIALDFLNLNTLACAKISALFLYQRIFSVQRHGWFNRTVWTTVVVIAMWYITVDVLSCFQCRTHFSAAWDGHYKQYCDLNPVWAKTLAISDFLLDIWVLVLPIPWIWRLHATTAKKLSIIGIFLLAFVGLGASIARIVFFSEAAAPGRAVLYIGFLESGMSITVVNLPTIWYLCTSTIPSKVASSLRSMRSLGSQSSQDNEPQNVDKTLAFDNIESPAATLKSGDKDRSAWTSRNASTAHGVHTDVEAGNPESFSMQDSRKRGTGDFSDDFPTNVIYVKNDVRLSSE